MFKFKIQAKAFADALTSMSRVLASKNALQILDNFKLTAADGMLHITAFSVDNAAKLTMRPESLEGDGEVLINAKKITEIVRTLSGEINVTINGEDVTLKTESGKYSMVPLPAEAFPVIDIDEPIHRVTFDTEELLRAFSAVGYAVSTDDYRPMMKGIYIDANTPTERITIAATNTFQLAKAPVATTATGGGFGVILPTRTVGLIQTLFGKELDIVAEFSETQAVFRNDSLVLTSGLIKGKFPDYNRVIPAETPITATIDRKALLAALSRVSTFGKNSLVVFTFDYDVLNISASDDIFGQSATETLSCECNNNIRIGFHGENFAQTLGAFNANEIVIGLSEASRPAKFTASGSETVAILMPMSLVANGVY